MIDDIVTPQLADHSRPFDEIAECCVFQRGMLNEGNSSAR